MSKKAPASKEKSTPRPRHHYALAGAGILMLAFLAYVIGFAHVLPVTYMASADSSSSTPSALVWPKPLDKVAYDTKMLELAHIASTTIPQLLALQSSTSTLSISGSLLHSLSSTTAARIWPHAAPYPQGDALLPFNRIVAYYGNFYSTGMGVLGEYPVPQMLQMLEQTVAEWQAADPTTPVIPAIDYIAVTAQGSAGADGMYRDRMPSSQIDKALQLAAQVQGIVVLDVQVGLSNVETEVPLLKKYLAMPNVELALDPEFAMHNGAPPGTVIGSLNASDINFAAGYLAQLVDENKLPPKILIVHRFTQAMVTNADDIQPLPEVQIVMDMDGWGSPMRKEGTYDAFINPDPVEFTGFKLFYKNDIKPPSPSMMTPAQILDLNPQPIFIQYQ